LEVFPLATILDGMRRPFPVYRDYENKSIWRNDGIYKINPVYENMNGKDAQRSVKMENRWKNNEILW